MNFFQNMPKFVTVSDITTRDGYQHEEKFIPTDAKLYILNKLVECGFKKIEVTNFGNPKRMPQFRDAHELMKRLQRLPDVEYSVNTMTERAILDAIEDTRQGFGPHRVVVTISTSEPHNKVNSGKSVAEHWKQIEKWLDLTHQAGIKFSVTISTIWGCPIAGPVPMDWAVDFAERLVKMGVDDVGHADHDGQASPDKAYEYFSRVLDRDPHPHRHAAHFHVTRGWGLANVLSAMQAGIVVFESTLGGIGGQPANFIDGVPVAGTGKYYYSDPSRTGLIATEDLVCMLDGMGIETGIDVDKLLQLGAVNERIVGRQLRAETVTSGRLPR
ncbi:MAG: pyruvate carboxyltransferase [Syntrophomonadaceae bacterium]|nr:pyruvate carboxyltransferase [Syntrophomonadaceae bacterium]